MREFFFYGTQADWWSLLDAIPLNGELTFIPDLWYTDPAPSFVPVVDDRLKAHLLIRPRVFLWASTFEPPQLSQVDAGPRAGQYSLVPGPGVPVISLWLPLPGESDGVVELRPGSLGAPTGDIVIGRTFEGVRSAMKKVLRRHKVSNWIWIGSDALQALQHGRLSVIVNGQRQ